MMMVLLLLHVRVDRRLLCRRKILLLLDLHAAISLVYVVYTLQVERVKLKKDRTNITWGSVLLQATRMHHGGLFGGSW